MQDAKEEPGGSSPPFESKQKRPRKVEPAGADSPTFGFITIRTRVPRRIYGCDSGGASAQPAASLCATEPASAQDAGQESPDAFAKTSQERTIYEIEQSCTPSKRDIHNAYMRAYNKRPDARAKRRAYRQLPHVRQKAREYSREYNRRPEVRLARREWGREYARRPYVRKRQTEYNRSPLAKSWRQAYNARPKIAAQRRNYHRKYYMRPGVRARICEQRKHHLRMNNPQLTRILNVRIKSNKERNTFVENMAKIANGEPQWIKSFIGKSAMKATPTSQSGE